MGPEEHLVEQALRRRQAELRAAGIFMTYGCQVHTIVCGRVRRIDFTVTIFSTVAVELDDPHHNGLYAADKSKDELLEDCNVRTLRIPIRDTELPELIDDWIDRIVRRAMQRWAA